MKIRDERVFQRRLGGLKRIAKQGDKVPKRGVISGAKSSRSVQLFHANTLILTKKYFVFSPLLERTLARYLEVVLMRTDSRPRKDIIGVQQD